MPNAETAEKKGGETPFTTVKLRRHVRAWIQKRAVWGESVDETLTRLLKIPDPREKAR